MTRIKTEQFQTEAEFRRYCQQELEKAGFLVKALSVNKRTYRQLANLGDLEVRKPEWQKGQFVRIEVKLGTKWGWSSAEQEEDYLLGNFQLFLWKEDVIKFVEDNRG